MKRLLSGSPFRVALIVALIPTFLAGVGVWAVYGVLENRLMQSTSDRLEAELQGFAALYDQRRIPALRAAIAYRADEGDPAGSVYVLLDRGGEVLAGNLTAWPDNIAPLAEGQDASSPQRMSVQADHEHLVSAQTLRGGFALLAGVSLAPVDQTLAAMLQVLSWFGVLMLAAGLISAALIALGARSRIASMNSDLARVAGGDGMSVRLDPPKGHSEYVDLVRHINAMLDRISHLFDAHQRLGNVVAHEMRTPLARIRLQLDQLDLDAVARAGLDEEIRNTIRLFDSLLSIAQMDADAGRTDGLVPVDMAQIVTGLAELYGPVAEEGGRHLETSLSGPAMILGDGNLVSQLFSNLIENALKYTRPGDSIHIELIQNNTTVRSVVRDTGPGIDADLKSRIFTPFARGQSNTDQPGHGLGLSLVRAIALRHGARPRIGEAEKGFAIEIDWLHLPSDA